jgi:hypothetical protein
VSTLIQPTANFWSATEIAWRSQVPEVRITCLVTSLMPFGDEGFRGLDALVRYRWATDRRQESSAQVPRSFVHPSVLLCNQALHKLWSFLLTRLNTLRKEQFQTREILLASLSAIPCISSEHSERIIIAMTVMVTPPSWGPILV